MDAMTGGEIIISNALVVATSFGVAGFFARKWMNNIEDKLKELCKSNAGKVSNEQCLERLGIVRKEVDTICHAKEAEHKDMWDRLQHHAHDTKGRVVDTTGR